MFARRLFSITTLAALLVGLLAVPAMAQFAPRFSTRTKGPPAQWHAGIGSTVLNIGDHTGEWWPELDAVVPIPCLRLGVAVPLQGETLFLLPELEVHIASTKGKFNEPYVQGKFEVNSIRQWGFSIMLSILRAFDDRRTLLGAGLGYYLMEHNPETTPRMREEFVRPLDFLVDPFKHIGLGVQLHAARAVANLKENVTLMLEGRYKVALMSGEVDPLRNLLMSEFQITVYVAVK